MNDGRRDIPFAPPFAKEFHLRGVRRMYPRVPWAFYALAAAGSALCAAGLLGEKMRGLATISLVIIVAVVAIVFLTVIVPRILYAFARSKVEPLGEFTGRATADGIVLDVEEGKIISWPWNSLKIQAADDDIAVVSNRETGIIALGRELFESDEEWTLVRERIVRDR